MKYEEKTLTQKNIYNGSIISLESLTVMLPNGREAKRDIVRHPGACVVIPVDGNGDIYMVRQYRKPIEMISLELPAGKLDRDEEPAICARRELKEETGLDAANLKYLLSTHSSPGFSDEVLHIFVATGLTQGDMSTDEDEFLSVEKYSATTLVKKILDREITDSKSIIGILMAEKILRGDIDIITT